MSNCLNRIKKLFLSIFVILLMIFVSISLLPNKTNNSKKIDLQSELKEELLENIGNYDSKKIVLQNTNKSLAKEISNRLNAKLRITNDGSFATLTLNNGNTILDVVSNPDNKDILKYLSIDYKTTVSEILNEEDDNNLQINKPNYTITDPLYNNQTYLDYVNLSNIWSYSKGDNITVAIIDTGIDYDHEEFNGRISEYSYNATEDKIVKDYTDEKGNYDFSLVDDEQGHGTAVTGVIAASMNNGVGITGIAPNVTIITIKAECDENGNFYNSSDLVFGLYYAIERDVDVVNMSFGGIANIYSDATKLAVDSDIICVAAAGNNSTATLTYPAADPNVIGVGALKENSFELANYSNFGENVNVVAPGTVYTTLKNNEYGVMTGTSFASPIVSSIIALQIARDKTKYMEFSDKCELLYASSYDLGDLGNDFYYGYGLIDTSAFILEERKIVTFNYLTEEIDNTEQVFIKGHPLQNIPEPVRNYAVFDGWYYDIHCKEEYNLYSDSWINNITLYCNWVNEDDGVPYTYVELEDGTIEIRSYTGKRRYITVPDYIDEKVVSSIGKDAFKNQTRLRVINLPSELKTIKANAFENCTNLTSIYIPDSVTSIGESAFENNIKLYNVNFNSTSNLQTIGTKAFSNCSSLVRFDIPVNVSNINGFTFLGSTNLKQVNASINSKYFISIDGILYNKSKTSLLVYPAGLTNDTFELIDSVIKLDVASFAYSNIKTIDLKNVTNINNYAFYSSNINTVNIPDSVSYLGEYSFYNSKVSSLTLGKGIKEISGNAFALTSNLKEITIPNSVLTISNSAFNISTLNVITFEENSNLMSIGQDAFSYTNVSLIDLPNSVVLIGTSAFNGSSLSTISISNESNLVTIGDNAFNNTYISSINLPSNLEYIGSFAFGYTKLTEVNIPSSVNNLSSSAFASCHNLLNINIDEENNKYTDIDGVVYTKDLITIHEYPAGKTNTSYTINDGVIKVEEYAFYGANNLNYIYLPSSLTEISEYAFAYNTNLRNITIPANVTLISRYAFYNDLNLTSINISNDSKLDRLSYASFANCGIYSFTIPSNVSTISQYVFSDCNNLSNITFASNSKLESISAYQFIGCNNLQYITFNNGSKLTNIQAHAFEGLNRLYSINFGDAKVENIDNYAFRYCSNLSSITIPETVTNIGRYAFFGCSNLSKVTIPESVEFIGRYAFNLTNNLNVYFESNVLPINLQENWDYGINGYYVGVKEVYTEGDFELAKLNNDTIAIIKYNGSLESLDLTTLNLGTITQIGGNAFNRSSVKEIVLPSTIKSIEKNAFSNSSLETINIPSSVVYINDYAFYNSNLNNITIEENSNLEKIGSYAFSLCDNLTNINIPNKVSIIGSFAFSQSGLQNVLFDLNNNLTEINEGVFQGTKLSSVNIPNSVTLINNSAFRDIETLKEVNFGTSKLQIMSNAFYNTGLTKVSIPSNIEYIGEYAFVGLNSLNEFIVDSNNPYYASVDGVLYSKDLKKLIVYPSNKEGSFTVPNYVEVIGFGAFENSKLETINFEEGINLLTLGYRSFYNAKNLKEITIPESVVSIDYYAFAMCKSLETVNFSVNSKLTGIYEGAFYGCISLSNIVIPDEIYEISDYAFSGCLKLDKLPISENNNLLGIYDYAFANSGIEELVLPESLLDIGSYAFKGIKATNIVIPDANKEQLIIGIGAFQDCNELEEITIPFIGASLDDNELGWFGYIFGSGSGEANIDYVPTSLKKVIISEGQTTLYDYAFYNVPTLEEIDMPSSIKYLGENNMYQTTAKYSLVNEIEPLKGTSLNQYMIGKGIEGKVIIGDSVTSIGYYAFRDCTSLTNITIPSSVTSIGHDAFYNCTSLTNITIPSSVTRIGWSAFYNCASLTNITIPSSVTSIESSTFEDCTSLTNITLPSSVTSIGGWAFSNCTSLTNITIPSSVTSIEVNAFSNCTSLENVYYEGTIEDWCNITFSSSDSNPMYYASHFYIRNSNNEWEEVTEIEISSTLTTIGYQFTGFENVTNITIPSSVTSIGSYAFYNCASLENVYYEGTIEDWCNITFSSFESNPMYHASHFYIRNSNNEWEEVTEIEIPSTITSIGDYQFYGFKNVKSVTIPSSVTSIGWCAFASCSNLIEVYNSSNLVFTPGSSDYGYIADHALKVDNKGTIVYIDNATIYEYFTTEDGFKFLNHNNNYYLLSYTGNEEIPVLPAKVNGRIYYCCYMDSTLKNIKLSSDYTYIYDICFQNCVSLESIVIPSSVTSISDHAFYNCKSLKNIIFEEGSQLTNIGKSAFKNCKSLTNITIPSNVTSIGIDAFLGCINLIKIYNYSIFDFDKGSSNYGYIAYYADEVINYKNNYEYIITDDGFKFLINNNSYYLLSYTGSDERPVLPATINGSTYKCQYMDSTLKHIELSSDFTRINSGMFKECHNLKSIIIPNTVTSINNEAFYNCTSLTNITIPSSVRYIGSRAFENCTSLENVYYEGTIEDWCNITFNYYYSNPMWYASHFYIRNTNNEWEEVSEIEIPSTITSIGDYQFYSFENVKNITIPSSVRYIGSRAFENCTSLENVYYEGTIEDWCNITFSSSDSNPMWYASHFYIINSNNEWEEVTEIEIPSTITSIGDYQFIGFENVTNVIFEEGGNLTSIGGSAFSGCTSLENVYYEGTIEDWCNISFESYYSNPMYYASHFYIRNTNNEWEEVTEIEIPSTLTSIGDYQFYGFENVTNVIFEEGSKLTSIGGSAFSGCTSLTNITIPSSVTSIGDGAFYNCTAITNIIFEEGSQLTSIGQQAFQNCKSLTNITIPSSVTSIGSSAFRNCTSLTNITIPSSVTSIESSTFYNCKSLTNITLPSSVTSIKEYAFRDCTSLANVTFEEGSQLTSIGNEAFYGCTNLFNIYNHSELVFTPGSSDYGWIAYYTLKVDNKGTIVYKDNTTIYEYFTTEDGFKFLNHNNNYYLISYIGIDERPVLPATINGSTYRCQYMDSTLKDIELSTDFTSIYDDMFGNCSLIESIVIPNTVTSIGNAAFYYCTSLANVIFEEGSQLTSMEYYAFYNCTSLTDITIPSSVTSIGKQAFYNCQSLTNITVPSSVTSIGRDAFNNTAFYNDESNWNNGLLYLNHILIKANSDIESYILPDNITCIAQYAFEDCYKLKYVEMIGDSEKIFNNCTNIETIVFMNINGQIQLYFYNSNLPLTLKNIVLTEDCDINSKYYFNNLSNVNIYVDKYKTDVTWDIDYPNWNNGNKVYYKGEWINAKFYDENDNLLSSDYYSINQIIKQPLMDQPINEGYIKRFMGWDIDGDGFADSLPATSNVDITAKAVYSIEEYIYTVNYYDLDGKTVIGTQYYSYNDDLILLSNPTKKGYTFNGWINYPTDLKVIEDLKVYSSWTHLGNGHNYEEQVVLPTCTEKGYTLHKCSICDESYKDNFIDELGHSFGEWITTITPSCETEGLKHKSCSVCGHTEEVIINITGHNYSSTVIKAASCESEGTIKHTCSICDDTYIEYTEVLPHNYQKKYVSKSFLRMLFEFILNILYGYEGDKAYYYECVDCKHILLDNEHTTSASSVQNVCEHNNCNWNEIIESTCCEEGYEAYVCDNCDEAISLRSISKIDHTEEIITGYASTYTQTGLTDGVKCSVCGEILVEQEVIEVKQLDSNFKIKSAFLNVTEDINIVYRTTIPSGYTNFYMVFTFMDNDYVVNDYFIDESSRYCFIFNNIVPQYMGENIEARLYATVEGEEVFVEQLSYSVRKYCVNQLNKLEDNETNKVIRTLLSDLLAYGAASQQYSNYDTENLVTKDLVLNVSEFTSLDETYNKQLFTGVASDIVTWKNAGLYLGDSMTLRLGFIVNDVSYIENLKLQVSINGRIVTYNINELTPDSDGLYRIYYKGVMATEFNDVITAQFISGETQIGRTLQYSVNTYIYKNQNYNNELLTNLLKAIYNYGKSAEEYKKYVG